MSHVAPSLPRRRTWPQSLPFYYGWVNVVLASLAMTATLPGRTHGLGLVTEQLLRDLQLDRVQFARINFVASLTGAAFCIPTGWLLDRFGVRPVIVLVTTALGLSVIGMSTAGSVAALSAILVLVRGFGQSASSVASMAAVGKWFRRRLGIAMGWFAVLLTFGFIGSVLTMGWAIEHYGWRGACAHSALPCSVWCRSFGCCSGVRPRTAAWCLIGLQPTSTPSPTMSILVYVKRSLHLRSGSFC